jgi:hypothetical protein
MLMLWFKRRKTFKVLLVALVASGMYGNAQVKTEVGNRYLYTLNCDATLEKFDTLSRTKVSTSDLAKHSRLIPTHGDQANSVVDGCATDGAAYQAKNAMLYTISPTTGSIEPGAIRHYRILSFHLPDLKPGTVISLPGKYDDDESPTLISERSGEVGIITHGHYNRIANGHLIPAKMPSLPSELPGSRLPKSDDTFYELNLSTYHSNDASLTKGMDKLSYKAFERSGDFVLIRTILPRQGQTWIVADTASRNLTSLSLPFNTTDSSVHLAPGGKFVLVQEASYSPARVPLTKDRLALIDATTGSVMRSWTDPALNRKYILTVTPSGEMVYFGGGATIFSSLNIHPSGDPTVKCGPESPFYFYADY